MNHIARQLEKHLDDLEEVVAARDQRMTVISRLTQRKAEQVKASLKAQVIEPVDKLQCDGSLGNRARTVNNWTAYDLLFLQHARIQQSIQKNVALVAKSVPAGG